MTDDRNTAYTDGVRLGVWLESTVRPALAKWGKSADARVSTLATVLSELIEAHVGDALDGALLGELYGLWVKHAVTLGERPDEGSFTPVPRLRRLGTGPEDEL